MTLVIKIDMDNAAFEGGRRDEVRRILKQVTMPMSIILTSADKINLRDSNGNTVGYAEVTDD